MCFIFCILILWHIWDLVDPGWTARPRASKLLEIANNSSTSPMQTYQSRAHIRPHFKGLSYLGCYSPALITSYQAIGDSHVPQSPLTLFKLANPKSAHPALLIPDCRNHNKGSCPQLSLLHLASGWPWCFSTWPSLMVCPLIPEAVSNKLLFTW